MTTVSYTSDCGFVLSIVPVSCAAAVPPCNLRLCCCTCWIRGLLRSQHLLFRSGEMLGDGSSYYFSSSPQLAVQPVAQNRFISVRRPGLLGLANTYTPRLPGELQKLNCIYNNLFSVGDSAARPCRRTSTTNLNHHPATYGATSLRGQYLVHPIMYLYGQ